MKERSLKWRVIGMTARIVAMAALPCVSMGSELLAVRNMTLIDGTGRAPVPDAVMVVKGSRIVAAGASGTVVIPKGARVVRFPGKYVIPGLMDANVHLYYWLEPESLIQHEGRYESIILEAAQLALRYGVTTVFDTWGPRAALAAVRDQINAGAVPGTRIFMAGNIIGLDGPLSADFRLGDAPVEPIFNRSTLRRLNSYWTQSVGPDLLRLEAEQVRIRIRDYIATYRPDFLKYAGSAHGAIQFIAFSRKPKTP